MVLLQDSVDYLVFYNNLEILFVSSHHKIFIGSSYLDVVISDEDEVESESVSCSVIFNSLRLHGL